MRMAKKVHEEGVHFFIVEDDKPRYFIRLTLRFWQERKGFYGMCVDWGTGTAYCDELDEAREVLLDLVGLHLNGVADSKDLHEWLTSRGVALYPIPEIIRLEDEATVALVEPALSAPTPV